MVGKWRQQTFQTAYDALPIKSGRELAVDGRTLIQAAGIKPGPALGKIIKQLTHAVVTGQLANDRPQLLQHAAELKQKEG